MRLHSNLINIRRNLPDTPWCVDYVQEAGVKESIL
jgi:hypothetical protein